MDAPSFTLERSAAGGGETSPRPPQPGALQDGHRVPTVAPARTWRTKADEEPHPLGERLGPWSSDSQWARNPLLFSQAGVVHATPRVVFLSVLEDESPRRQRGRGTPIRPPTPTGPASQALAELRRHFTAQGTTLAS